MHQAPVGWQCPDCIAAGAKKTRVIRPFAGSTATGTGIVGSTNPTPVVIGLVVVNVVVFVVSGFGKASVIDRFGVLSHRRPLVRTSTTGSSRRCSCTSTSCTSPPT